jgi:hydrogenase maturation protease
MSEQRASAEVVVIGYGNELRGDDGIGPQVARAVAALGRPNVRALAVHQLTPELAEAIAGARLAIFIDACTPSDAEPVQVKRIVPGGPTAVMGHSGDPRVLLALAQELYGQAPPAWSVVVTGKDFRLGQGLSPDIQALGRAALKRVASLILDRPPPRRTKAP